jgi:flagellar motor switch protein FliN
LIGAECATTERHQHVSPPNAAGAATVTASNFDLDMIGDAAAVLAEVFGLGDNAAPIDVWAADDGDEVIGARIDGDEQFHVFLAVNRSIAGRLLGDADRLRTGLTEAVKALIGDAASFSIEDVAPTSHRPSEFVGVFDRDELCAIFGVASADTVAAAEAAMSGGAVGGGVAGGGVAGGVPADAFEPQAFRMSDAYANFNPGALELLHEVEMEVTVELGRTTMPIKDLLSLQPGMVVEIDRAAGAPIDVLVNGRRIASGEVVVIDEEFGVRITDILAVGER